MDWTTVIQGQGGLVIAAGLVLEFLRRLSKGDLVLGATHQEVVERNGKLESKLEEISVESRNALKDQAAASRQQLDQALRTIELQQQAWEGGRNARVAPKPVPPQ